MFSDFKSRFYKRLPIFFVFALIVFFFSPSSVSADVSAVKIKVASRSTERLKNVYSTALNGLVDKLQKDFKVSLVELTLDEVGHFTPNAKTFGVVGNGTFTTDGGNSWQPIEFEIFVNNRGTKLDLIQYQLPKPAPIKDNFAAAQGSEEMAIQGLLNQLKSDYQTENIVVALDDIKADKCAEGQNIIGRGEMRVGDSDWKKFHFKLTVNDKQGEYSNVNYILD